MSVLLLALASILMIMVTVTITCINITAIIGCIISGLHAINESNKRNDFIVSSVAGIVMGVLAFYRYPLILSIASFAMCLYSISLDETERNMKRYIIAPILVGCAVGLVYGILVALGLASVASYY